MLNPEQALRISRPRRIFRYLFQTWQGRTFTLAFLTLLLAAGWWFNEHRPRSWIQAANPLYWVKRMRGEDLFDAEDGMLLHGNHDLKEVALTFDDGPHPASLVPILNTLKRFGIHATFFDVGMRMTQHPDLVRRTLAEGNEIGNHTYTHRRLHTISELARHHEINDTDITFYSITGQHLTYLRPPGMRYDGDVIVDTKTNGYLVVGYDTASHDYALDVTPDYITRRTLNRVENGSIILLHDYPHTAQALPNIIEELQKRGYRFVTISEMIAHLPEPAGHLAEEYLQQHAPTRETQHKAQLAHNSASESSLLPPAK